MTIQSNLGPSTFQNSNPVGLRSSLTSFLKEVGGVIYRQPHYAQVVPDYYLVVLENYGFSFNIAIELLVRSDLEFLVMFLKKKLAAYTPLVKSVPFGNFPERTNG